MFGGMFFCIMVAVCAQTVVCIQSSINYLYFTLFCGIISKIVYTYSIIKRTLEVGMGGYIVYIIIAVVVIALLVGLYFLSKYAKKLQDKQAVANEQMREMEQTVSMLVIDKKMMKLTEAGFPQMVVDQAPKLSKLSKVPVVKAKVGPKVMSLMCDPKVFNLIPVKKEVKAMVSGIYITGVKGLRTGLEKTPEKKKFMDKVKGIFNK